jgi:RsiW-degrading membrane proteinase PrsW (M82 family)
MEDDLISKLLLFVAVLPVILICKYVYNKDRNKEPNKLLTKFFVAGIGSALIAIVISLIIDLIFPNFTSSTSFAYFPINLISVFIGIALVEESSKFIMVYKIGYNNREFDELYDMIVYAVFVSMGFATFENILYVLGKASFTTGIIRALTAVPGHAAYAVFMGYYLSLAKLCHLNKRDDLSKKNIIKALLIPTCLHGIYDFCVLSQNWILIICFFIFVIALFVVAIQKLKEVAGNTTPLIVRNNNYCPNCGSIVNSDDKFCQHCGKILIGDNKL